MRIDYPLEQLILIKQKRADDALKEFLEKKKKHEQEIEKLQKAIKKKEEIEEHYEEKLHDFYASFQEGTNSLKIKRSKDYLKTVLENLKAAEEKIKEQEKVVEEANKEQKVAKKKLDQKRLEVEKLELHRKEWRQEVKTELERKLILEQDEIGGMTYSHHKRRKKK